MEKPRASLSLSPRDILEAIHATIQLAPCRPHEKSNTNTLNMKQNECCCYVEMLAGAVQDSLHCSVFDVVGRLGGVGGGAVGGGAEGGGGRRVGGRTI